MKYSESLCLCFVNDGLAAVKADLLIFLLKGYHSCCSYGHEAVVVLVGGPYWFVAGMFVPWRVYSEIVP